MSLPPASSFASVAPRFTSRVGLWNARLMAYGHRDLYLRELSEGGCVIERVIPEDAPFEQDPEVIGAGETIEAAWEDARAALERPAGGGGLAAPGSAASDCHATAPPHGPETAPPGQACRAAPRASMTGAAGGHGWPSGFEQMEMFA